MRGTLLTIARKYVLSFLSMVVLAGFSNPALAVISCSLSSQFNTSTQPVRHTVTLAGSFYAGEDLPVGSIIYRVQTSRIKATYAECDTVPYRLGIALEVESEPSGPPFSLPGSPYSGDIYPTNVPGIGVAIFYFGGNSGYQTVTTNKPLRLDITDAGTTLPPGPNNTHVSIGFSVAAQMMLIKTGPVASGATVNGIALPSLHGFAYTDQSYVGTPLDLWWLSFNGSMTFISQTCQTPDITVDMGSYDISTNFKGEGSVTEWKDASIQLQNCPTFNGYHGFDNPQTADNSGVTSGATVTANLLRVSLRPLTSIIDAANGVFAVDASSIGGGSPATGVGLQLGYTADINATATSPTTIWTEGTSWNVILPGDGRASFRIPLAARYYQTSSAVTPGQADGKVVFTLDYN